MIPLPAEDDFLLFWDALSHDLAMFASEHPDRVFCDELSERLFHLSPQKARLADEVVEEGGPGRDQPIENLARGGGQIETRGFEPIADPTRHLRGMWAPS